LLLTARAPQLINGILEAGKAAGHDVCGSSISGMFGFFFCKGPVTNFKEAMGKSVALCRPLELIECMGVMRCGDSG
jgi:glutamate-1-semialdehyde aminotransferase